MRVVIEPGSELGAIVRLPSDGAKPAPAPAPVVTGQLTPEEQAQPQYRALTRDDLIAAIRDGLSEEQVAEAHDRTVAQVRYTLGRHGLPDLTGKPRPRFEAPDPPLRAVPERRAVTPEAMRAAVSAHPEWTIDEHAAAFGLARGVFGDTLAALKISLTDLRRELALALTAATVGAVMRDHPDWSEQRLARYWGMQAKSFCARLREADIDLAVLRRELSLPTAAPPEAAPTEAAKAGLGTVREFSEAVSSATLAEISPASAVVTMPPETVLERAVATGPDRYAEDRRRLATWWLEHPLATLEELGDFLGCGLTSVNHWVITRFHRSARDTRTVLGLPQPPRTNQGPMARRSARAEAEPAPALRGERYEMAGEWTREELGARLYHLRELVGVGFDRVKARIVLELR